MGYRTVVVFSNDRSFEWMHDPKLGEKIRDAMYASSGRPNPLDQIGGQVLECAHGDTVTLAMLDGYSGTCVGYAHWTRESTERSRLIDVLRNAASAAGFDLVEKNPKKSTTT